MRSLTTKALILAAGIFWAGIGLSGSGNAGSLRQGSASSSGAVTGSLPGQVLWTYYLTLGSNGGNCPPFSNVLPGGPICNAQGIGDNLIRLVNPNGAANGNLAGATTEPVCAMLYVFDADQEMGECCGCPLSSAQLATFSVEGNLTSNWGLQSSATANSLAGTDNSNGAIAIVAASPNATAPTSCAGESKACNGGCDPTNVPGYSLTTSSNLLGSITHNQELGPEIEMRLTLGITETPLSDDGGGDPTNLVYLQEQCGALIGNDTGGGICNCPTE
jgi:hypothetical protein